MGMGRKTFFEGTKRSGGERIPRSGFWILEILGGDGQGLPRRIRGGMIRRMLPRYITIYYPDGWKRASGFWAMKFEI